ncbi:MAG: glycogen debranching enzyme N-terminal domain-containing protein [Planctomycetota bacterium]
MTTELTREWLEADGLGGFAMGSADLARSRRYHALLCTAATPPTGRMMLVAGNDVELRTGEAAYPLSTQRYAPDVLHPRGDPLVTSFTVEPWPCWEFGLGNGMRVRYELFVPRGSSAVVQRWTLLPPVHAISPAGQQPTTEPVWLEVRPFLAGRDYHWLRHEHDGMQVRHEPSAEGVRWQLVDGVGAAAGPAVIAHGNGEYRQGPVWYRNFRYREETERGFADQEDLLARSASGVLPTATCTTSSTSTMSTATWTAGCAATRSSPSVACRCRC